MVAHACNLNNLEGEGRKIRSSRPSSTTYQVWGQPRIFETWSWKANKNVVLYLKQLNPDPKTLNPSWSWNIPCRQWTSACPVSSNAGRCDSDRKWNPSLCVPVSHTSRWDLWHGCLSNHMVALHFLVKSKERVLRLWLGTPGLVWLYVILHRHIFIAPWALTFTWDISSLRAQISLPCWESHPSTLWGYNHSSSNVTGVSLHAGCCNRLSPREWLKQNTLLFATVLKSPGNKVAVTLVLHKCVWLSSFWVAIFLLHTHMTFLTEPHLEGEKASPGQNQASPSISSCSQWRS